MKCNSSSKKFFFDLPFALSPRTWKGLDSVSTNQFLDMEGYFVREIDFLSTVTKILSILSIVFFSLQNMYKVKKQLNNMNSHKPSKSLYQDIREKERMKKTSVHEIHLGSQFDIYVDMSVHCAIHNNSQELLLLLSKRIHCTYLDQCSLEVSDEEHFASSELHSVLTEVNTCI